MDKGKRRGVRVCFEHGENVSAKGRSSTSGTSIERYEAKRSSHLTELPSC